MHEKSQKDIVFIGNASSDSENDLEHEKVLRTIRHVAIIRCILAQPKDMVDWRRILIFYTWIKTGEKIVKSLSIVEVYKCCVIQFDFEDRVEDGHSP